MTQATDVGGVTQGKRRSRRGHTSIPADGLGSVGGMEAIIASITTSAKQGVEQLNNQYRQKLVAAKVQERVLSSKLLLANNHNKRLRVEHRELSKSVGELEILLQAAQAEIAREKGKEKILKETCQAEENRRKQAENDVLAAEQRVTEGKEENERMLEAHERATRNHRRLALADWRKEKESITADAREVLDATKNKLNERILAVDMANKMAETENAVLEAKVEDLKEKIATERASRRTLRRKLDRAREQALFREIDRRCLRADLRRRQEHDYMLGSADRLDAPAAGFHAPDWTTEAFLPGVAPGVDAVADDIRDEQEVIEVDMRTGMRAE